MHFYREEIIENKDFDFRSRHYVIAYTTSEKATEAVMRLLKPEMMSIPDLTNVRENAHVRNCRRDQYILKSRAEGSLIRDTDVREMLSCNETDYEW